MEENKDIKDEDIIVENEPVIEDTDNVDKAEAAEAEEIVEEYSENDDLSLIRKMKDENKWFILTITAIEHGKYHLFAFYDHSEDVLKELDYLQQIPITTQMT